jgi:hypothetical protein
VPGTQRRIYLAGSARFRGGGASPQRSVAQLRQLPLQLVHGLLFLITHVLQADEVSCIRVEGTRCGEERSVGIQP